MGMAAEMVEETAGAPVEEMVAGMVAVLEAAMAAAMVCATAVMTVEAMVKADVLVTLWERAVMAQAEGGKMEGTAARPTVEVVTAEEMAVMMEAGAAEAQEQE